MIRPNRGIALLCIELLNGTVNLVPIDAWNSLVNSGDVALFKDKAIELNDIYFKIQNYNYEAKRVRDAIEHDCTEGLSLENGKELRRSDTLKENFNKKTKKNLLEELKNLKICFVYKDLWEQVKEGIINPATFINTD